MEGVIIAIVMGEGITATIQVVEGSIMVAVDLVAFVAWLFALFVAEQVLIIAIKITTEEDKWLKKLLLLHTITNLKAMEVNNHNMVNQVEVMEVNNLMDNNPMVNSLMVNNHMVNSHTVNSIDSYSN